MTVVREEEALTRSVVRIRSGAGSASGDVVGAGFLVGPDVVCTCAHVVARAAGLAGTPDEAPPGPVSLDFPMVRDETGTARAARAIVVAWGRIADDDSGDVALLRLDRPVPGTRPAPLVDGTRVWEHPFRVIGFPAGFQHGLWARGTLRGPQGAGWLQMETPAGEPRITAGFSGSPVWDARQDGVVGMTVAAQRGTGATTAYLIPSAQLVDESVLRPRCPFRGLAPFAEDDAELFHGRAEETERLRDAVARHPLTLVVGPSGSGKSSLVRAGLLPRLQREGFSVSELRAVPGADPAAALARAVVPLLEPGLGEVGRLRAAAELAGLLTPEAAGALRDRLLAYGGTGGHVLFVDQLEEYAGERPDAARQLLRLLVALSSARPTGDFGPPGTRPDDTGPDDTGPDDTGPDDTGPDGAGRSDAGVGTQPGAGPVLRVVATARPESLDVLVTSGTAGLLSGGAAQFLAPLSAEGLHQAVTAPVDAVPGLWFEAGLPERIVADAADEPGRMPLVEFALTRLWEERERSMLTHTAYARLGGVAGALVGYAEQALRTHVAEDEAYLARRLFAQLARPVEGGGFARRPARTADLAPDLQALARRLAPTKLVVLGQDQDGAEIVDLAHEQLASLWPRLHEWLAESRDFRQWQEQLRRDLARWRTGGREPDALLRGGILDTASDWLARRPEDIPPAERDYIRQSERQRLRGVRRWQAVAAALTVLVLLAGVLTVFVQRRGETVGAQLRTQASRVLADLSHRHEAGRPALAMQFAMAAWRTEQTPEAYGALLRQYPRGQRLTGSRPGLWPGRFLSLRTTRDGSTAVVRSVRDSGEYVLTVITGLHTKQPEHRTLRDLPGVWSEARGDALSPDGRSYAMAGTNGSVWVWDLTGDGPPVHLPSEDTKGRKVVKSHILDYSGDGRRLLRVVKFYDASGAAGTHDRYAALSVWDLPSGGRVPTPPDLVPGDIRDAAFTADAGQVVFTPEYDTNRPGQTVVRELTTGRQVAAYDPVGLTVITGDGDLLLEEVSGEAGRDRASRTERTRPAGAAPGPATPLPDVVDTTKLDVTGEFAFVGQSTTDKNYQEVTLIALRTGRIHRTRVPSQGDGDLTLAVVPGQDDRVTVLLPTADALLTATAVPVDAATALTAATATANGALSPDGRLLARTEASSLEIVTADRGSSRRTTRDATTGNPPVPVWTADSKWVVLERSDGGLAAYRADDPAQRVDLHWDAGTGPARRGPAVEAVEPMTGSELAVFTADGRLMLVDAATGGPVGPATQVERKSEAQAVDSVIFTGLAQLRARPGHPDEVALVTSSAATTGTVEIRNVRTGARTQTLTVGELQSRFDFWGPTPLLFNGDGSRLVTRNADGFLHQWALPGGAAAARPLAVAGAKVTGLIGFGARRTLITTGGDGELQFWDLAGGLLLTSHPTPADLGITLRGTRLSVAGEGWYQDLDLSPDEMMKTLCTGVGRDFTASERELLPGGAVREPPCG
ncbi:nSTAND1 domain-containing NTPase [Streptomyces sp. NPDC004050]